MRLWHSFDCRGPAAAPLALFAASLWRELRPEAIELGGPFSFRRPGRSPLLRLAAHVLIRLLVVGPLPPNLQVTAALFPVSLLVPLVSREEEAPGAARVKDGAAPGASSCKGEQGQRISAWDAGHGRPVSRGTFTCTAAAGARAEGGAPGRVYWLLLPAPTLVDVGGSLVSPGTEYRLPLSPGWNGVATPWLTAVEWADSRVLVRSGLSTVPLSQAVAQGWIEGELKDHDPSASAYATILPGGGQIEPWRGYVVYSSIQGELVFSTPPADTAPPKVAIASPTDGAAVTEPVAILGTVEDENLLEWKLEYSHGRSGDFAPLATGASPVSSGMLGTLDPTLLTNGLYVLRLSASDLSGHMSSTSVSVVVRDNQKVGQFTVSFVDLEVPLAGMPIRVTRTYDSRERGRRGDFGLGWHLDLSQVRAEEPNAPGVDWSGTKSFGPFPTYCLEATRAHLLTLTMPDGRVYEFEAALDVSCQFVPIDYATVVYRARPGTLGSLAPLVSFRQSCVNG